MRREDRVSTTIAAKEALRREREREWACMDECMCGCWGNHVRGISEAQALPTSPAVHIVAAMTAFFLE